MNPAAAPRKRQRVTSSNTEANFERTQVVSDLPNIAAWTVQADQLGHAGVTSENGETTMSCHEKVSDHTVRLVYTVTA